MLKQAEFFLKKVYLLSHLLYHLDKMMAYALETHREDLLKILEQPEPDVHYSLTCQ
jgi:hypothetical protein